VLILDEPTAALAPKDADELFTGMRGFREGIDSAMLITHRLREALAIADEITVLRHGTVTGNRPRESASNRQPPQGNAGSSGFTGGRQRRSRTP
jgi:simple sugar transport system ATP-binding protein